MVKLIGTWHRKRVTALRFGIFKRDYNLTDLFLYLTGELSRNEEFLPCFTGLANISCDIIISSISGDPISNPSLMFLVGFSGSVSISRTIFRSWKENEVGGFFVFSQ